MEGKKLKTHLNKGAACHRNLKASIGDKKKLKIYIDGGSRGNPGPSACAAVIMNEKGDIISETARFLGKATNNIAEYSGLHLALVMAKRFGAENLEIYSDSQLLVRQYNGEYSIKDEKLNEMMKIVSAELPNFKEVKLIHIGRALNKKADKLVNDLLNSKRLTDRENLDLAKERNENLKQENLF